ncbi:uncharacterized protein LOC113522423 [Galleria mellonella]|uniref:Uncharacterized protein LOC113522423 n=1 Tax=Galleria mellonella TaxID=7137 RepID=A0A6J1X8I6_GALME|nr:uncharacterized protein LOC113522423 [Galleria mellonella]
MAFSLRKMLSNITYFKKPGEGSSPDGDRPAGANQPSTYVSSYETDNLSFDRLEPDSTSKHFTNSLKLSNSIENYASKKGSLSDTDVLVSIGAPKKDRRKGKKLKLDIKKASQSMTEITSDDSNNVENTPKHILLDCKSADLFSQRFKSLDFNKSFEIFDDDLSDESSYEDNFEILTTSEHSNSDISILSESDVESIKMCRKVEPSADNENILVPSTTPESFADVELDRNEDKRTSLLLNYQMKLERLDCLLKKLLTEFQFHIEVSKVFNYRSVLTPLPDTDVSRLPKMLGEVTYNLSHDTSPSGSWNIVMEKEDSITKFKVKTQLLSIKHNIDEFVNTYLQNREVEKKLLAHERRSLTFDLQKEKKEPQKRLRINDKKKYKHFDFPDLREAMLHLFGSEEKDDSMSSISGNNITQLLSDYDEADMSKCICRCRYHRSPSTQSDSGVTTKNDRSLSSQSISSSIGNFSLDSSTLTAYSESLDQIISYNSFQDTSLYSTFLQKAAIERITFYVQVHSIQLKCEPAEDEFESKNTISFYCPACKSVENDENGLLKHILSQIHCEKIHFLYKTAYIKKCVSTGKEIQPSTVLNPMVMYRDDNKIVCFGDAMYACSLCFENLIIGESVLMAHCAESAHVERREKLSEILD